MPAWRQEVQRDDPGVSHSELVAEPSLDTEINFPRWHSTVCSRGDHPDFENCTLTKVTPASNPQMALRIKFNSTSHPEALQGWAPRLSSLTPRALSGCPICSHALNTRASMGLCMASSTSASAFLRAPSNPSGLNSNTIAPEAFSDTSLKWPFPVMPGLCSACFLLSSYQLSLPWA